MASDLEGAVDLDLQRRLVGLCEIDSGTAGSDQLESGRQVVE